MKKFIILDVIAAIFNGFALYLNWGKPMGHINALCIGVMLAAIMYVIGLEDLLKKNKALREWVNVLYSQRNKYIEKFTEAKETLIEFVEWFNRTDKSKKLGDYTIKRADELIHWELEDECEDC